MRREFDEVLLYDSGCYLPREPHWLFRWGTMLLLVFFSGMVIMAAMFSYNDTLNADVIITTIDPPINLTAKIKGELTEIMVKPGDTVSDETILAVFESPALYQDIQSLKEKLIKDSNGRQSLNEFVRIFPSDLKLGSAIQGKYRNFIIAYKNELLYRSTGNVKILDHQLNADFSTNQKSFQLQNDQKNYLDKEVELAENRLERFKILYGKGVVSKHDLEQQEMTYLEVRRRQKEKQQNVGELGLNQANIQSRKRILRNETYQANVSNTYDLLLTKQALLESIRDWEEMHLIKSPVPGRVSFLDIWSEHQQIQKAQTIFTVIPLNEPKVIAKCEVPIRNSGKLKRGQEVRIHLDNYPSREWGTLKGRVNIISEVPRERSNSYVVFLTLDNLQTSYGREISLKQSSAGNAEIILEKMTVLQRLFFQFKGLWSNETE